MSKDKEIEKLKKQVERYESKGYKDTAAHVMLARLLKDQPVESVKSRNAKKGATEEIERDSED